MPTKLKIKMGHIEFEYEGDANYDNEAVKDLFSHLESLAGAAPPGTFDALPPLSESEDIQQGREGASDIANLSVATVAARLGGSSGREVALAAAAQLQICQGKTKFSRRELLAAMKEAHGHYNKSMSGNLTSILQSLIQGKQLLSMADNQMCLSASELDRMRSVLAQP